MSDLDRTKNSPPHKTQAHPLKKEDSSSPRRDAEDKASPDTSIESDPKADNYNVNSSKKSTIN